MTRFIQPRFSVGGHSTAYDEHYAEAFSEDAAERAARRYCADETCQHSRGFHTAGPAGVLRVEQDKHNGACTVIDCPCTTFAE